MDSVLSAQAPDTVDDPQSAFVYFYDPEDVMRSVVGWPSDIRAAVCLAADGVCDFVLFHEDEENGVLPRVAKILNRAPGTFATNPAVSDHPERKLVFSEETALIKALRTDDGLLERAQDYAINYRFARDEGLEADSACDARVHADVTQERLARRSVSKIFPLAKRRERRDPPQGYHRIDPAEMQEFDADLFVVGGRLRLARPGDEGLAIFTKDVALRDDLAAFHVPSSVLGKRGADGLPLDMPLEAFTREFRVDGKLPVQVSILPTGVFVRRRAVRPHLAASIATPAPVSSATDDGHQAETAVAARSRRSALYRSLNQGLRVPILAAASLVATGFFSAMVAETLSNDRGSWLWLSSAPTLDVFSAEKTQ